MVKVVFIEWLCCFDGFILDILFMMLLIYELGVSDVVVVFGILVMDVCGLVDCVYVSGLIELLYIVVFL